MTVTNKAVGFFKRIHSLFVYYIIEEEWGKIIFELLSIILIVVSAIFIYLIMRSKMIADIYSIGVYRCLGAPKIKIIGNSLVDVQ